jgi:hypothetical protein
MVPREGRWRIAVPARVCKRPLNQAILDAADPCRNESEPNQKFAQEMLDETVRPALCGPFRRGRDTAVLSSTSRHTPPRLLVTGRGNLAK